MTLGDAFDRKISASFRLILSVVVQGPEFVEAGRRRSGSTASTSVIEANLMTERTKVGCSCPEVCRKVVRVALLFTLVMIIIC